MMSSVDTLSSATLQRAIVAERILNAPRELVFTVWTEPEHIAKWWGPTGFTNTIHKMDVRAGGEWSFIMHGPDGTDYRNEIVYTEVVRPERIVYDHISGPVFQMTILFDEVAQAKTKVSVQMLFETAELRDRVAREVGAVEGLNQTLTRMEEHLRMLS